MKRPKTVKSLLAACITLANTPIADLRGIKKLNEKEQSIISGFTVILQNELGDNDEILEKHKLKYP